MKIAVQKNYLEGHILCTILDPFKKRHHKTFDKNNFIWKKSNLFQFLHKVYNIGGQILYMVPVGPKNGVRFIFAFIFHFFGFFWFLKFISNRFKISRFTGWFLFLLFYLINIFQINSMKAECKIRRYHRQNN